MADEKSQTVEQCTKAESSPEYPRSPSSKSANGDHEYVMLGVLDVESDSGSAVSVSSIDKSKSLGSSVSSFAEVVIPDMEATLEKGPTEEEVQNLVEDAKKDIPHNAGTSEEIHPGRGKVTGTEESLQSSRDATETSSVLGETSYKNHSLARNSPVVEGGQLSNQIEGDRPSDELVRQRSASAGETELSQTTEESLRSRASTDPVHSGDESDDNAVLFNGVTYLGSSTVNAPVSEIELKRTMAVLREQTEVTIDVLLYVGSTSDSMIRLKDPETQADIATYRIQRILFCGRGDAEGNERDCFAFNTVHGDSDIFHCHVFRCTDPERVSLFAIKFFTVNFSSLVSLVLL